VRSSALVVLFAPVIPVTLVLACGSGSSQVAQVSDAAGLDATAIDASDAGNGSRDGTYAADAVAASEANESSTEIDAGTGAVGVLGQACSPPGSLACEGNAQKLQLLCDASGHWVANGTCSGSDYCDTAPGPNAGSCQAAIAQCANQMPGFAFCDAMGRLETCGADLVSVTATTCMTPTPYCMDGGCEGCEAGAWRCNGTQPEDCQNGIWYQGGPNCINGPIYCVVSPGCPGGAGACCQ
jgi:hypothetical protein